MANIDYLKDRVRDVPDFPQKGVTFKDITPLLDDPEAFRMVINHLRDRYKGAGIKHIVSIESRGFIFGAALAYAMGTGLAIVRKPGKLPYKTYDMTYDLEYGTDTLQVHQDAVSPGDRVIIVDDVLATGGTLKAVIDLMSQMGASVHECAFLAELVFLGGRDKAPGKAIHSVLKYS